MLTEWQKDIGFLCECRGKHTTHYNGKKLLRLTVQIDLTINVGYISTQLKKREDNGSLQFTETTGLQKAKHGFEVIILCKYVVFCSKIIPYILYCYILY